MTRLVAGAAPMHRWDADGAQQIVRGTTVGAALLVALLIPSAMGAGPLYLYSAGIADAVAVLSIVLLTGMAGQLSLAQAAFMGVGALTAAHLAGDLHVPVLLAMFGGGLAAVPVGMVAAVPALRVGGVQLAVITLAYGQLLQHAFFDAPGNGGAAGGLAMPRPSWFGGDASFARLEILVFAGLCAMVVLVRTRRTGRNLALLRESETAAFAVGVDVVRTKVAVFALSAFIAGVAGSLLAGVSGVATAAAYGPFDSIGLLAVAVIGGTASVAGAVVGGMFRACGPSWVARLPLGVAPPDLAAAVMGLGMAATLLVAPQGVAGALSRLEAAAVEHLRRAVRGTRPRRAGELGAR